MGGSESSGTVSDCRGRDFVGTMRNDLQRSSRRSVSETSGTVRHGRFQYLGDRPLELTDSLKGYNRVSEFCTSRVHTLSQTSLKPTIFLFFSWFDSPSGPGPPHF
jgi:hypothetical protein